MSIFEDRYIKNSDDIDFLLDLCRDLIKLLKTMSPNKDIPIDREQLAKLNSIAKRIH
ncbi:MAG: hypothetical protein KAX18_09555 [Candidatus Lokiarchaeota archaeon]|nr:hypothetical protein [Candidatus Lokiarchaeota archaeon]